MNLQFNFPNGLQNPEPSFKKTINTLIASLGAEMVNLTHDRICQMWASANGYYYHKKKDKIIFNYCTMEEEINPKYFLIDGYWKDDGLEFRDCLVCSTEFNEDEPDALRFTDDEVFFYGLTETQIKRHIQIEKGGNVALNDGGLEFVITNYTKL